MNTSDTLGKEILDNFVELELDVLIGDKDSDPSDIVIKCLYHLSIVKCHKYDLCLFNFMTQWLNNMDDFDTLACNLLESLIKVK